MIAAYKDRGVSPGDRVHVYRNVNSNVWSIRAAEGPHKGLVVAHADEVALHGVVFSVNETGRQKVIATGRKNVHAWAAGNIFNEEMTEVADRNLRRQDAPRIRYNPYEMNSFRTGREAGEVPVNSAHIAHFDRFGVTHAQ